MRVVIVLASLVGCRGTTHVESVSLEAERANAQWKLVEQCAVVTGVRHDTCMRIGPPRAPERNHWETARWWLYESRSWDMVPGCVECTGPQVVCASYVAFEGERVVESDEQCHHVKHYEP